MQSIGLIYFNSEFGCLEYHTKGLEEAIQKARIPCHSFHVDKEGLYSLIQSIKDKEINHFITFKRLNGGKGSLSIQKMFNAPIVLGLVEFSFHHQTQIDSEVPVICIDESDEAYLKITGNKTAFYQPLGVRPLVDKKLERDIDISFFGNIVDPVELMLKAKGTFSSEVFQSVSNMIDYLLKNPEVSHLELLTRYLGHYSIDHIKNQPYPIFCAIEYALRSLDRIYLLKNITKYPIHLYGKPRWERGWKEIFKGHSHIKVLGEVSYDKSIELMARSHLVLNSSPHLRHGIHERVFYSLLMGTPCLSNDGPKIREYFGEDRGVVTYQSSQSDNIDALVDRAMNLDKAAIIRGKEIVLKEFSWDAWLEKYLRSIPSAYNPKKNSHTLRV